MKYPERELDGAVLYVVATPIGNLEDVTHRALRVISDFEIYFCEGTRITNRLLEKYNINSPSLPA